MSRSPSRTSVVGCRDGVEPLLSRRVPNLKFDLFPSQLDRFNLEINADRRYKGRVEGVVGEAEKDAGFSHAWVSDQ